ncbi:hypothetical protein F5146DRAFT_1137102 [Armillaria mellea]|nr:hypothetical protein F5146DRAFT_1137102 [Armillaria mellea]
MMMKQKTTGIVKASHGSAGNGLWHHLAVLQTLSFNQFLPEASDVEAEPQQKSSGKSARKINDLDKEEFNNDVLDNAELEEDQQIVDVVIDVPKTGQGAWLMSLQALYAQNFAKLPLIPTPSPPDGLSPNQSLPTRQYHFCITAICLRTLVIHPILKSNTSQHYRHVNTDFDGPPIVYGNAASTSKRIAMHH